MKTIGLLGGMSWESTDLYYQQINQEVHKSLGGLNSAKIILNSVNFSEIEELQKVGNWKEAGNLLKKEALKLQLAGVDGIALCTNTMHICASQITNDLTVPFLHIADATAQMILEQDIQHIALLGTRFTMEQPFYREYLEKSGIRVAIPNDDDRMIIHDIIYNELCHGKIIETSRLKFIEIIQKLKDDGAKGIVLGCTEIGMLLPEQEILTTPLFDTTKAHVKQIVDFVLELRRSI
ncbi:aspartate/glutamate racemase family protein [Acinetobacter nectaris]|uniref:aspartate/glutamate racemase family protein n=1 Tax=Acinetobacter nectaris TaxID=1219382 RepID=UPI001F3609FD|nr:aspartate/glutamate racemase family protein [Acinetobacter nectaris]MCF9034818.1 aspartate/glutamate racemase family protein [Acinetobacter nectaris]